MRDDAVVGYGTIGNRCDPEGRAGSSSRRRCRATSRRLCAIIGGIAERVDSAFEEIDDLQLAVERLPAEAGQVGSVSLSFEISTMGSAPASARWSTNAISDALADGEALPGVLTLRRILQTVVDSFGVETAEDGSVVVRLRQAQGRLKNVPQRRQDVSGERAREEDRELLRRYHDAGDMSAREELIERHLPLVRSLARRYAGRGRRSRTSSRWGRSA